MTIRYKCDACDSVLKIKDELAGTDGKCPKCKKKFTVPTLEEAAQEAAKAGSSASDSSAPAADVAPSKKASPAKDEAADAPPPAEKKSAAPKAPAKQPPAAETTKKEPAAAAATASKDQADDEFDAAAFLMEGNDGPSKPSAGLSDPGSAPKPSGPPTDAHGRRHIIPPSMTASATASDEAPEAPAERNASANARDLLAKNSEESRIRSAGLPPEEEKEPWFDWQGLRRELLRGLPFIAGIVLAAVGLYFMVDMMLGAGLELPDLARVRGKVTIDGAPFANVKVNLSPVSRSVEIKPGKKLSLRTATAITDENGEFDLYYMEGVRGAALGRARLWLEPVDPADFKKIPPRLMTPRDDPREVRSAGNDGNFDIEITTE